MKENSTILLADDDVELTNILGDLLKFNGFHIITAHEGIRAIEFTHKYKPDLIILDMKMPAGGGDSVLQALKSKQTTKHIPVIVLSGLKNPMIKQEVLKAGAQEFLSKPYNAEQILQTIHYWIPQGQTHSLRHAM